MILIVCIDKKNGMLFNNRRQSSDEILNCYIIKKIKNSKLWINDFSKDIFEKFNLENIIIDNDFYQKAGIDEYCFVENIPVEKIKDNINKIILYNWNRDYPADQYFNICLDDWKLESENEFSGKSHERITEKVYIRGK